MTIWNTIKNADKNPPNTWTTRNDKKGSNHQNSVTQSPKEEPADELVHKQEEVLHSLMQKIEELKNK